MTDLRSHPDDQDARREATEADREREFRRELAEDQAANRSPLCAREGCRFPAVLGIYCGLHQGEELRSRSATAAFRSPADEPVSQRRLLT